ncbi:MAG TPA: pyruvate ferredoxin oxidoreductase [Actinobacteria bacterium]|nr:pyruvate ferredoxin oxidoreductase [Actinomycetota bacterium]
MAGQIEGSRAVAKAVASCRPDLICGCQGTVPGSIMAALAGQTRRGALARYGIVDTDSEAAAIAAALRAAGSGARAYTAAASQGLLQASEAVFNAAGLGLPVVMTAVTQPDATGASSWDDHSDAMSQRDSGWVQLYAETIQEAADLHIQAFRIAEALSVPVMVCVNGSLLTGATGPAGIADQDRVDAFLPRRVPGAAGPVPLGRASDPEAFTEVRYLTHARQLRALGLIPGVAAEFREVFGRESGGLVRPYRLDGARTIVVALSSALGTIKEAVDGLRAHGMRIGALGITSYRPFPLLAVRQHLAGARQLVVVERALAPGIGGVLASDIQSALRQVPVPVSTVIAGLGGRQVSVASLREALADADEGALEPVTFLGLNTALVERELHRGQPVRHPVPAARNFPAPPRLTMAGI